MDQLHKLLEWLTNPAGRVILTMVGGFLIRMSPLHLRVFPAIATVANILLAIVNGLAGDSGISFAEVGSGMETAAISVGIHSGIKNSTQAIKGGAK